MTDPFDAKDYWESRHSRNYGLESVGYCGLGLPFNSWMYRIRRRVFLKGIRDLGIEMADKRVLDIGSGTGFYIDRWRELGVEQITGVDLSKTALESLRAKFPGHDFLELDISEGTGPFVPGQFDIISAFDVLYHIVDEARYRAAIRNISLLLSRGGLFVMSENFLRHGEERGVHQVSRSLEYIEALLGENDLIPSKRRPMFCFMNRPIDSGNGLRSAAWNLITKSLSLHYYSGHVVGALLYPLELACLSFVEEGPSTEMLICEKRA